MRVIFFIRVFISSLYSCRHYHVYESRSEKMRVNHEKGLRIRGSLLRSRVEAWWHWCDPIICRTLFLFPVLSLFIISTYDKFSWCKKFSEIFAPCPDLALHRVTSFEIRIIKDDRSALQRIHGFRKLFHGVRP